jgi:hypothetical protein
VGSSALVIARSTIDPAAPTGRKVIAQGRAKRRPGIGVPETTQALKGRNRRRVNPCVMFRPFRAWANWGAGAPSVPRVALRSTLGYLIMPRWGERSRGSYRGSSPSDRGHFHRDDHTPTNRRAVTSATGSLLWAKPSEPDRSHGVCRQFLVVRRVRAAVPWSLDSSVAQTTKPQFEVNKPATHGPRNVPPSTWAVRLWLSRDQPSIRPPRRGAR